MIKDLFVCLRGTVKERGSDWKFKKERSPDEPVIWEFKIAKIEELHNVKGTLIKSLNIGIELEHLTDELVNDLKAMAFDQSESGRTSLYFNVNDSINHLHVKLFARSKAITVSKPLMHYLEEQVAEELLEFGVNR
jgi:hypothetical protein